MKVYFLSIILFITTALGIAQTSGYRGSRIAIKSDLVQIPLHKGFTVEGEFVVLRRISLTFEYGQGSYNGGLLSENPSTETGEFDITRRSFEFGTKLYFGGSGAFQAPRGFYFNFRYGFGYVEGVGRAPYGGAKFALSNFPIHGGRLGVGYQFVFARYIVVDPSVSVTFRGLGANAKTPEYYNFSGFRTTYAGDFTGWGRNGVYDSNISIGFVAQLRVGFLIPTFKKAKKPNYVI